MLTCFKENSKMSATSLIGLIAQVILKKATLNRNGLLPPNKKMQQIFLKSNKKNQNPLGDAYYI
jgi:hypothetical protein